MIVQSLWIQAQVSEVEHTHSPSHTQMQEEGVTAEQIFEWLLRKNAELSCWPPHAWAREGVSFDAAAKAREAGFYLGCTTAWKWELDSSADGGRRWGTSALVSNRIVDRDLDTNVGRVTGPASGALRYWERVVAE